MKHQKPKPQTPRLLRDFTLNHVRELFETSGYPVALYSEMPNGKSWGDCTAEDLDVLRKFYIGELTVGELELAGQLNQYWLRERTIRAPNK